MKDIQSFFPYPVPRRSQTKILDSLQSQWNEFEVFVVRVPVAGGKSAIATTLQDWALSHKASASIVVPNNMLREQYTEEFSWLRTLKKQDDYMLTKYKMSVKEYMKKYNIKFGPKGCAYNEDRRMVKRVGTPIVMNYMGYQAHKLFRNVLIVDEAHQLLPVLQGIHATRIWKHEYGYPDGLQSASDILLWLEGKGNVTGKLQTLKAKINSLTPATTIEITSDLHRGEMKECIKLSPLNVSGEAPIFWPNKTKKIILMSATINETDVDNMGLGDRSVLYLDAESEIPEERRRVNYIPIGSMSAKNRSKTLPNVITKIQDIVQSNEGRKGFIHATYDIAKQLKPLLDDDRFIFHNKYNKKAQFTKFLESDPAEGKVFVGSGMAEGIDLKYDLGRFQIITKIPFQSLASPCNRFLASHRPKDYIWMTTKELLQESGRICRTPDDTGETYILDSDFDLWYDRAKEFKQIPTWFNPKENKNV